MGVELGILPFTGKRSALTEKERRKKRLEKICEMQQSFQTMFGSAAYAIARAQPAEHDVGWDSGICWRELSNALRRI
jgi:hypothetical protein